jgi:hypothetical protein
MTDFFDDRHRDGRRLRTLGVVPHGETPGPGTLYRNCVGPGPGIIIKTVTKQHTQTRSRSESAINNRHGLRPAVSVLNREKNAGRVCR